MKSGYLASNIQYLRKKRQLSQAALAENLGMTRSKIASYENNKAEPSAVKLAALARFFNVSLSQLIESDLQTLPNFQILPANTNIREDLSSMLEDRCQIVENFEEKSIKLRKIAEGFRAFYELKMSTLSHFSPEVESLSRSFENVLQVMDSFVTSNEELIEYLKKITGNSNQA